MISLSDFNEPGNSITENGMDLEYDLETGSGRVIVRDKLFTESWTE
jgi:hypothetical protein